MCLLRLLLMLLLLYLRRPMSRREVWRRWSLADVRRHPLTLLLHVRRRIESRVLMRILLLLVRWLLPVGRRSIGLEALLLVILLLVWRRWWHPLRRGLAVLLLIVRIRMLLLRESVWRLHRRSENRSAVLIQRDRRRWASGVRKR